MDIDNKLNNYLKITDIVNSVFIPEKPLKKTRIQIYNTLGLSTLLYGNENWTIKARDAIRTVIIIIASLALMLLLFEIHEKNNRIHLDKTNTDITKYRITG
jgi:hypothetical protein